MDKFFIPSFKLFFPTVEWYGPEPHVYLTFDDGPHPVATPAVLDVLRDERIRSTFFLIGEYARKHPNIVERIAQEGHVIGNHTMTHYTVWFSQQERLREEVEGVQQVVEGVTGNGPTLFRPPFNRIDRRGIAQIDKLGLRTVLFSVNTWDFLGRPTETIVNRVERLIAPGDVVAFHDNHQTADTIASYVSSTIRMIRAKGLSFGTLE